MKKSYTKYRIKINGGEESIRKIIEAVLQEEYETRKEVNDIRRNIMGLFGDIQVEIMAVSRYTKVRRLV